MKNVSSAFLKIFNKIARYDKTLKIHMNGIGNNYPDFVESIIAESVTASTCAEIMASYLTGKGFGEEANKIIVHKEKEITLLQLTQKISKSISEHYGVFIHVNYDGNYDIKTIDVLSFSDCRIGKIDDDKYNGKIFVCEDWGDKKKTRTAKEVDVYNPNKKIIKSQVEKAKGLAKYNGQILFFKIGKYSYPLSPIHPALKDAESEAQVSIYKNISLKKGFFGKTMVITKPLVDADEQSDSEEYYKQVGAREEFRKTIQQFIGAENSDGVIHFEMEFDGDKIENEILFKQIDSNINDKLFAHTENSVSENICVAYRIPPNLVKPKEGAIFSASGEMMLQMKLHYQEQTNDLRMMIEQIINKLMMRFQDQKKELKIIPLIVTKKIKEDAD